VVAFLQNPLIGIGFNQLSYFIEEINAKSMYPSEMKVYGSHDLYWGPTAELGFLYLLFLVISIIGISKYLKTRRIEEANLHNSLGAVALFFGISFLISGSIQYRHLWIILALINSYYINSNMKLNTKADHE
jgi:O-antigen ligase